MALWRDPLDELIADLERALPPTSDSEVFDWPQILVDLQSAVGAVLSRSPDERARLANEVDVGRALDRFHRCLSGRSASEAGKGH
jgi:hypothetical protein